MSDRAVMVEIADAVAAELNAAVVAEKFEGLTFQAIRSYADFDEVLKDESSVHVDVVPGNYSDSDYDTRSSIGYQCGVDIIVRRKLSPADRVQNGKLDIAVIDRLVLLGEEIHQHFAFDDEGDPGRDLTACPDASFVSGKMIAPCHRKMLRDLNSFSSVLRLTYELSKVPE